MNKIAKVYLEFAKDAFLLSGLERVFLCTSFILFIYSLKSKSFVTEAASLFLFIAFAKPLYFMVKFLFESIKKNNRS